MKNTKSISGNYTSQRAVVSVIIPTFNRVLKLTSVIDSYTNDPAVKEVIIVDDASTDRTEQEISRIAIQNKKIIYIRSEKNLGAPESRNIGVSRAEGDYIFFGEDDLFLDELHITKLLSHLDSNNADIVAGRRIWMQTGETTEASLLRANTYTDFPINYDLILSNFQSKLKSDTELPLLDASMLIDKKVFNSVSYDKSLVTTAWREETDFQLSAVEAGFRLFYCPSAISYHLSKENDIGGNHSMSRIKYEYHIFLNNRYFYYKHLKLIKKKFTNTHPFIYFARFELFRIWDRNLLPFCIKQKALLQQSFVKS